MLSWNWWPFGLCLSMLRPINSAGKNELKEDGHRISSPTISDNKVHGANMGPFWGRQDPGGPHVCPMNFAIWDSESNRGSVYESFW